VKHIAEIGALRFGDAIGAPNAEYMINGKKNGNK